MGTNKKNPDSCGDGVLILNEPFIRQKAYPILF